MKTSLLIVALTCFCSKVQAAPYLDSIFQNPTHPQVSVGATFSSQFSANGAATMLAVIYHAADPNNSLIPKSVQALGMQPVSWAVNVGVGGNAGNYFIPVGVSVNLTPTVLGPALKLMNNSGNKTLQGVSSLISSSNGGVAFGPQWTAYPLVNGDMLPLNHWRFPPGWYCGATFRF